MIRLLPYLVWLPLCLHCESSEDLYRKTVVKHGGPQVESIPVPLKSCSAEPRPTVTLLPAKGAPLQLTLLRSYHVCLGKFAALLRLANPHPRAITRLVLERQWWDVRGKRPPRKDRQIWVRQFGRGDVRYLRLDWREGYDNPGERQVRLRLAQVDFADGGRWNAPPWPRLPPPRPQPRAAKSLPETLRQPGVGVQKATGSLRTLREKLEKHPLIRRRPGPRRAVPHPLPRP